jgi:hypothetical protein
MSDDSEGLRLGHVVTLLRSLSRIEDLIETLLEEEDLDGQVWQDLVKQVGWINQWAIAAEEMGRGK